MMRIAARALLVMASMFGCGLAAAAEQEQPSAAQMMDDLMYGRGPIGGPFTLTDRNGKPRSDIEFRGKLMIVYFGYTFCPDVCPADLMSISQALEARRRSTSQTRPEIAARSPEPAKRCAVPHSFSAFAAGMRWASMVSMSSMAAERRAAGVIQNFRFEKEGALRSTTESSARNRPT
jgi:hypothetical protein